ncbi:MAG: ribonuclease [Acidimicrobiaceae bacterium]
MSPTVAYTDGACSGNPGPGGWAWAVPDGSFAAGAEAKSTNQRMEIAAAFEAVKANPERLEVVSDSTYVVNCFRDRWHEGWIKRGWLNSQRKPVANRDLWEPFIALVLERGDVTFRWVKGHSGDPMNDVVDRLAVEAALTQQPRRGTTASLSEPGALGPADLPSAGRDARLPPGRHLLVTGHRPPELGGYGSNPVAEEVRRKLREVLAAKHELHPDLMVVTGLQLGAEQLGAEAAIDAGVPFVVVQPYPAPEKVWPADAQRRYAELLRRATAVVLLERKEPATKQQAGAALSRRDAWLARNVDEAIVVWDGKDDAIGRLARSLTDHLGEEEVWTLSP